MVTVRPAEEVIAGQLARRLGSLSPGRRHLVLFEGVVSDGVGGWRNGRHPVGTVERARTGLRVRLLSTEAGRTARALLQEGLLGVALSGGYPPTVRLVADQHASYAEATGA